MNSGFYRYFWNMTLSTNHSFSTIHPLPFSVCPSFQSKFSTNFIMEFDYLLPVRQISSTSSFSVFVSKNLATELEEKLVFWPGSTVNCGLIHLQSVIFEMKSSCNRTKCEKRSFNAKAPLPTSCDFRGS